MIMVLLDATRLIFSGIWLIVIETEHLRLATFVAKMLPFSTSGIWWDVKPVRRV
jgi:hypothetical protein